MPESFKEQAQPKKKEKRLKKFSAINKVKYDERKYQTPIVMRSYGVDSPPPLVVIFGPPSSGKTLFMNSVVRCYSKQKIEKINGLVTLTAAKSRRLSFYECPADLPVMADTAKVADLVILIIDAQVGLEIETFEMLNLLKTHGFPKLLCVVTKLDTVKGVSQQRATMKKLKRRLWLEVCDGIKVLPMSKTVGGRYLDKDVLNASRHISQMKYRPFEWRASHPYIVADQVAVEEQAEEIAHVPEGMKIFSLSGYVRGGTALKKGTVFHLPGIGDYPAQSMQVVNDPCPLKNEQKKKLSERKKPLYAPMSDIRGMLVEKDAVYLDIKKPKEEEKLPEYGNALAEKPFSLFGEPSGKFTIEPEVPEGAPEEAPQEVPENCVTDSEDSLDEEMREKPGSAQSTAMSIDYVSDEESDHLDEAAVRMMFKTKKETEEDYIERFNDRYKEEEKDRRDIFAQEREKVKDAEETTHALLEKHSDSAKEHLEGVPPGRYVKVLMLLPAAVADVYTPENIFILGANKEEELSMTFVQGRVKRHKWFKKTLKTKEAHYVSMGWRRFQTCPVFSMKDAVRNRMLKYIPDSMTCNISFYAPTHPPGTSFTILRKFGKDKNFRIAANGVQSEVGGKPRIMKKLKLIGYPEKIKGHTVFVKDMFHTQEEAARYEGAMLKTVSGLRGQVKKAGEKGQFRASFEGQILMSEIIFLPCFFPITPMKVYLNAENFADSGEIKLLKEIRDEKGISLKSKPSSAYGEVAEPTLPKDKPIPWAILERAPVSMLKMEAEKEVITGSTETIQKLKLLRTLSSKVQQMKEEKERHRQARIQEITQEREASRKETVTKMKADAMMQRRPTNKRHKKKSKPKKAAASSK
ncbi:ribosome biogenesis protein BMS1 [Nematocida major]|uniref:ribosome biogenesis protein BMS1 n=1 Tax=Nematocida major TaxID=1912982 RepID=UPI0020075B84|nr:ribosome biogenesis protein BMS1 [Nematocida major]KAH9386193.1 ribosome biogenesis protein BMS1 [Nematocida major]